MSNETLAEKAHAVSDELSILVGKNIREYIEKLELSKDDEFIFEGMSKAITKVLFTSLVFHFTLFVQKSDTKGLLSIDPESVRVLNEVLNSLVPKAISTVLGSAEFIDKTLSKSKAH